MARIISTNFESMQAAMNQMIISETKKALALLPDKCIEAADSVPLCHAILSPDVDYNPRDVSVRKAWLDESGCLNITGYDSDERTWTSDYNEENTDWYDISDFWYLISQIAEKIEGDQEIDVRYTERHNLFYSPRRIGDAIEWIGHDGKVCRTNITGILAEQEDQEPVSILYTTNVRIAGKLFTAYLDDAAILFSE